MTSLPTLFVSHGAPTFALEPGLAGARLAALGRQLPRPQAVLVVSPHWMTRQPQATLSLRPETIHDFGGFDPALYTLQYPAAGAHLVARRALELLQAAGLPASPNADRGLDHGAWVPLMHLYPAADVPVLQVSLPVSLDADGAYQYGRALAPLADEGVLIVGSGSLTHNLYEFRLGDPHAEAYAAEFAHWVRDAVLAGDHLRLRQALAIAPHARRAQLRIALHRGGQRAHRNPRAAGLCAGSEALDGTHANIAATDDQHPYSTKARWQRTKGTLV